MKLFYSDTFPLPLPAGHRFPMVKYARLRERLEREFAGDGVRFLTPAAVADETLRRVHDRAYLDAVVAGTLEERAVRRIGFPWSLALVERSRRSVGATVEAVRAALADGCSINLAGGTHHAFADRGEGYCVFNDLAVAARAAQRDHGLRRIAIVDADVHQGNGTARIFAGDESVFTFSIHGARNYPLRKERSDLDLELADGTSDEAYLDAFAPAVARVIETFRPDLVLYQAGADPLASDRLGRLALTRDGLRRRDELVCESCARRDLPLVITMGGGYAEPVDDTVDVHVATVTAAIERFARGRG